MLYNQGVQTSALPQEELENAAHLLTQFLIPYLAIKHGYLTCHAHYRACLFLEYLGFQNIHII